MSRIFNECSKLLSLPDISKWNTNNVYKHNNVFDNCSKLQNIPNIFN